MLPNSQKMLIVEDDQLIGKLVQEFFSVHRYYEFFHAEDGEEAMVKAVVELPDVIITDLMLPKKSGIDFIRELRRHEDFMVTPIVVITAGSETQQEAARAAGASLIITKPFRRNDLVDKVQALLLANPFVRSR